MYVSKAFHKKVEGVGLLVMKILRSSRVVIGDRYPVHVEKHLGRYRRELKRKKWKEKEKLQILLDAQLLVPFTT